MLNKVMIIGRLGRDPELRYTSGGMPVANFTVATDESFMDKDGNRQDKTEWHRVVVFQRQAENCSNYLGKGSLVYVEGSLQTRKYQDNQGQERTVTEIKAQRVKFLDRKGERAGDDAPARQAGPRLQKQPQGAGDDEFEDWGSPAQPAQARQPARNRADQDLGPAFPSEASSMDDMVF